MESDQIGESFVITHVKPKLFYPKQNWLQSPKPDTHMKQQSLWLEKNEKKRGEFTGIS